MYQNNFSIQPKTGTVLNNLKIIYQNIYIHVLELEI